MNRRSLLLGTASLAALGAVAVPHRAAVAQTSTYGIPSDFPTLAAAAAALPAPPTGQTITLVIESGHQPMSGLDLVDGDWSHFHITSADPIVTVHPLFAGHWIAGTRARLPVLATLVDMLGAGDDGYRVHQVSAGVILEGCGVTNAGGRGLYVNGGSAAYAVKSVFTHARDRNVWITRGSTLDAERADFSNSGGYNAVYVSRASTAHLEYADVTNAESNGIVATRSWVDCSGADVSGAGRYGMLAERSGHLCADKSTAVGCGLNGMRAEDGSTAQIKLATITGSGSGVDIAAVRGSTVYAHVTKTTNGTPNVADCNVAAFNAPSASGVIYA